ncbi:copper transporter [Arsenicicoccus sp. oral taxon 190]|uniref:copper transporter n=1 Tax=Arsenicicoccus sp. oral taxon 190 TaxID=1658671 RepID=UPI00067A2EC3|nr:copper transporter [Arsenicicoccus sp. oral taxon 190]AKT51684.1 hypothetical protein ADJ73_11010 [Arsenicicoccus sp. oral taxon 190]
MIDFRYHLVSIIAIFMALAVGIVLGAGPLKEDIGTTLTSELTKLRQDKADLNTQLTQARRDVTAGQSFAAATRPVVLKDRLSGKQAVVVAASGADEQVVAGVETALGEAGAQVGSVVRLSDQWTHPDDSGDLGAITKEAAGGLGIDRTKVTDDLLPGSVLGRALLTSTAKDGYRSEPGHARQALDTLRSKGLLTVRGDESQPATLVVTVAAPLTRSGTQPVDPQVQAYANLVRAMDTTADGSVLVSPSKPVDDTDNLSAGAVVSGVRAIRPAAAVVSTVDDADLAMGQVATVVALQAQQKGGAGRYGTGTDAESVLPDLAR